MEHLEHPDGGNSLYKIFIQIAIDPLLLKSQNNQKPLAKFSKKIFNQLTKFLCKKLSLWL